MWKVLLLLLAINGDSAVVDPAKDKSYETKEACEKAIATEVTRVQKIFDSKKEIRGKVKVVGGRCFSLDEINKIQGGRSAEDDSI